MDNKLIGSIKLLLNDDNISDRVVEYWTNSTESYILNYCNLDKLPVELENICIEMTCLRIRFNNGGMGVGVKSVASVTDGSQSVSYTALGQRSFSSDDDLLNQYKTQLNRFRRLKW